MPVSHRLRCIFVHIPKTAGTSIEKALGMHGDWRVEDREIFFGMSTRGQEGAALSSVFLQHLRAQEIEHLLPQAFATYFRFSVVRNPWDRLVSAYANLDPNLQQSAEQVGIQLRDLPFETFVERSLDVDHAHLRPQVDFLTTDRGDLLVDYVARWENLADDFEAICRRLGVAATLPHANRSKREDYRDYYSAKTRTQVEARYREDIETFGYQF